jgi:hypothetical protein
VNASSDVDAFIDAHGRSYVAAIYPLEQVREADTELAEAYPHGKIVLSTVLPADAEALRPT